jgi:hypothetical protein
MTKIKKFEIASIALAIFLAMIGSAFAEMIFGVPAVPLGYCQISAATLASATGLASCVGGIPSGTNTILMSADTANVKWRDDGTAPTGAIGMTLVFGQLPVTYNGTISKLQFILATGGSPILNVSFYKTSSP